MSASFEFIDMTHDNLRQLFAPKKRLLLLTRQKDAPVKMAYIAMDMLDEAEPIVGYAASVLHDVPDIAIAIAARMGSAQEVAKFSLTCRTMRQTCLRGTVFTEEDIYRLVDVSPYQQEFVMRNTDGFSIPQERIREIRRIIKANVRKNIQIYMSHFGAPAYLQLRYTDTPDDLEIIHHDVTNSHAFIRSMHYFPTMLGCITRLDLCVRTDTVDTVERSFRTPGVLPNLRAVSLSLIVKKNAFDVGEQAACLIQTLALCTARDPIDYPDPPRRIGSTGVALWTEFSISYIKGDDSAMSWICYLELMSSLTHLSISIHTFPSFGALDNGKHITLPQTLQHLKADARTMVNLLESIGADAILPNLRYIEVDDASWTSGSLTSATMRVARRPIVMHPDLHVRIGLRIDICILAWLTSILRPKILEMNDRLARHDPTWTGAIYDVMKKRGFGSSIIELRTNSKDCVAWAVGMSAELMTSLRKVCFFDDDLYSAICRAPKCIHIIPSLFTFARWDGSEVTVESYEYEHSFETLKNSNPQRRPDVGYIIPMDEWPRILQSYDAMPCCHDKFPR